MSDKTPWRVWHWLTPVGNLHIVWHPRIHYWALRRSKLLGGYAADLGPLTLAWKPIWPPKVPV